MVKNIKICDEIWLLTVGAAGMQSQTRGLGEHLSKILQLPYKEYTHYYRFGLPSLLLKKWAMQPSFSQYNFPNHCLPRLLISCGRRSAAMSAYLKICAKKNQQQHFYNIHIQDPKALYDDFDMIIALKHDGVKPRHNIIISDMALHHITKKKLENERKNPHNLLKNKDKKILSVLIGGERTSWFANQQNSVNDIKLLMRHCHDVQQQHDAHIIISASRRTTSDMIDEVKQHLNDDIDFWYPAQGGDNPYLSMLASSDALLVSQDSSSMMCEAIASGKPTYVFPLAHISKKQYILTQDLINKGYLYDITQHKFNFEHHNNTNMIDETAQIAHIIVDRLKLNR